MVFSVFLGVNPLKEIRRLHNMVQSGYAQRLIIGGNVYGTYKWVMQKGTVDLKRFDRQGELWEATAKVTLKEYPKR